MSEVIVAILGNASAVASLVSALIAASVATIALVLNQLFARRQHREQFLQPKLEELYLLLNEVAERNARLFKLIANCIDGDPIAHKQLADIDDLEIYGHLTSKKNGHAGEALLSQLSRIHQFLFAAEREVNQRIWSLANGSEVSMESLIEASGKVGHMLRLMEQEMVSNREALLKSTVLPRRFAQVSDEEIKSLPPPPPGEPLSR